MPESKDPLVRLSEAVAAFLEFETGRLTRDEVLAANPEFADLLEPMFLEHAADEAPTTETREFLGEYRLIREIGRGGMGVVYEAEETSLGRRIALKVLPPNLTNTPKQIERFRREAAAAARLEHEGIVPIYSVGEAEGSHFFAMELVDGPSLHRVLERLRQEGHDFSQGFGTANLSSKVSGGYANQVVETVAEVAEAIEAAHEGGVIHRDLKPHNLLLNHDGKARVVDFGLAKDLARATISQSAEIAGTPHYMSPEQIAGMRDVDRRTDIYALGVVLYELLTLRCPFNSASTQGLMLRITTQDAPPLRKVNARVPRELEIICHKAIEKNADDRYQTAAEFAADLRRFQAHEPIVARPPSAGSRLFKLVRRRRAAAAAVVLGALLPIGGVIFYFGIYEPESKRHEEAFFATHKLLQQQLVRVGGFLDQAGMRKTAGEMLQQAVATMESLNVDRHRYPNHLSQLAQSRMQLAVLRIKFGRPRQALASFRTAHTELVSLCDAYPRRYIYDTLRLRAALWVQFLRFQIGETEGVEAGARSALTAMQAVQKRTEEPKLVARVLREVIHGHLILGAILASKAGRHEEALTTLSKAKQMIDAAPAELREHRDFVPHHIHTLQFLGRELTARNEHAAAKDVLVEARKLCEANSGRATIRKDHGYISKALAEVLHELGEKDAAEAASRTSIAMFESLLKDFPDDALITGVIARTWRNIAMNLAESGKQDKALEAIADATKYADQLPTGEAQIVLHRLARGMIASSHAMIRSRKMMRTDAPEVDRLFTKASAMLGEVVAVKAEPATHYQYALCLHNHAALLLQLNELDRCRKSADLAIAQQKLAIEGRPKNAKYQRNLSIQYRIQAEVAVRQEDHTTAAAAIANAERKGVRDLRYRQWAARLLVRCIALVTKDAGLLPTERDEVIDGLGREAVIHLRVCVESGVPKNAIAGDPSLKALHSREDWSDLFGK